MSFQLPKFASPDFSQSFLASAPDVRISEVKKDGVAPIGGFDNLPMVGAGKS